MKSLTQSLAFIVPLGVVAQTQAQSFYKEVPLFSTAPDEIVSVNTIGCLDHTRG